MKRPIGPKIRWASCFLVAGEAAGFSAIAGEDVAGRVRGVVGGEEGEECGNFFGLGVAAERDLAIDLVEHGVGVFEALGMTRADLMKFFQHLTDATESAFPLLIMNGVTGVRDMGGDLAQIDRWRSEIASGLRVGPHIIRAGPFVDGPKEGVSNRLTVRTPDQARQPVHQLGAQGVDFIKVHNALPPEAFFTLMDEARKEHIPVAVQLIAIKLARTISHCLQSSQIYRTSRCSCLAPSSKTPNDGKRCHTSTSMTAGFTR